ncbi:MAG: TonB-dependent receptor plug domain-containing protein [Succinivibrio sp.]
MKPLAVAAMMAVSCGAAAEEHVQAQAVTVTASRVAQELEEVPMSVSVITQEDIRKSSARTVGELLEDVTGVQVNNDGTQGLKRVSIRGEDAFRTLVMVDGQKISEHKSMSGSAILVDPASIERIEVIKGPASVLYGSDAIGGVVNIITKKGGADAFNAEASVGYDGAGRGHSESAAISGSKNGFHYRLSGSNQVHGDIDTAYGRQPNTGFRQRAGGMFLSYDFTDKLTAGVSADTFDSRINGSSFDMPVEDFTVDLPKWRRDKVALFAEGRELTSVLSKLRWDGYWQKNHKEMVNKVSMSGVGMDSTADNRIKTLGTSLQADWQLGDASYLITGYEFMRDSLDAETTLEMSHSMPPVVDMNYGTLRQNQGSETTNALFASMTHTLPASFSLNYGARYTHVRSAMDDATASRNGYVSVMGRRTNYVNYDDGSAGSTGTSSNTRTVFNAGLTWSGIDHLSLRATWAQGFRAAILQERYLRTTMGGGTTIGNPDLKPENSNNYELGARFNDGVVNVDAAVFYSTARDYITTEQLDSTTYRYMNADSAKTRGLELSASWRIAGHFEPYASLTWLKRKLEWDGYSTTKSGTPEFYSRYGLRTEFDVMGGKLTTDLYGRSQTDTESYSRTTGAVTRTAGFTTANFAVGYGFGPEDRYQVDAEILNIFDQGYRYNTTTYEPGRHVNLKFSTRF